MNVDVNNVRANGDGSNPGFVSGSSLAGKPLNLPYPSLGEDFKEPEIFCDMVDYYFAKTFGDPPAPYTRVAVYGERGGGKTRAAVEYAWSRADRYTALLFVTAHSWWEFRDHLAYLCPVLGIQPETPDENARVRQVLRWLDDPANAGWLLIIDSVDNEDAAMAVKDCLSSLQGGHAIITFFDEGWSENIAPLYLARPDSELSANFLLDRTEGRRRVCADDRQKALELAKTLEFIPLAMEMASACIGIQGWSMGDYLDRWREREPTVTEWVKSYQVEYSRECAIVWQLSIENLPPAAFSLLHMLSCLWVDPFPSFLLNQQADFEESSHNIADLSTPNDILRKLSGDQAADMNAALALLHDYHLLQPAGESIHPNLGKLHQSVLLMTRQRLFQENQQHDVIQATLNWVRATTHADFYDPQSWPIWEPLIGHLFQLLTLAYNLEISHPTSLLSNELAQLMLLKQRLPEGEDLIRKTLALEEKSLEPEHPRLKSHMHNLASVLMANGKKTEAEPLLRRLLDMLEREPNNGEGMPLFNTLSTLSNLLYEQGQWQEAEPMVRRALALGEELLPPDDIRLANVMLTLVGMLRGMPQFLEAEPYLRRALAINEQRYGDEHPRIADLLNSLAILLQNINRPAEAEMIMRRAIHIDEKALGPEHPNLARDLHCISFYFQEEKRFAEAEPLMRRALAIEEKCFGPDGIQIATALNNLALLLADTQRESEAEPLMRRALAITEKVHGPIHEDVSTSLNNLAQLIETQQPDEAEQMMRRQLVIFLMLSRQTGHDHPLLKKAINNYLRMISSKPMDKKEFDQLIADLGPEAGFDQMGFLRFRKRIGL
ncbi:MAG: tetratricopeptide repeat protein [Methylococcaceae bacterium]|nr:tetratricopeptide repeat protein [Methylococcaceae bacterium]